MNMDSNSGYGGNIETLNKTVKCKGGVYKVSTVIQAVKATCQHISRNLEARQKSAPYVDLGKAL